MYTIFEFLVVHSDNINVYIVCPGILCTAFSLASLGPSLIDPTIKQIVQSILGQGKKSESLIHTIKIAHFYSPLCTICLIVESIRKGPSEASEKAVQSIPGQTIY